MAAGQPPKPAVRPAFIPRNIPWRPLPSGHFGYGCSSPPDSQGRCGGCGASGFHYTNGTEWSFDGIRGYRCLSCHTIKPDGSWAYPARDLKASQDLSQLHASLIAWAEESFPRTGAEILTIIQHLCEEIQEVVDTDGKDLSEWADVQMILWHAVHIAGFSFADFINTIAEKLRTNQKRTWERVESGVTKHVEDPQ